MLVVFLVGAATCFAVAVIFTLAAILREVRGLRKDLAAERGAEMYRRQSSALASPRRAKVVWAP